MQFIKISGLIASVLVGIIFTTEQAAACNNNVSVCFLNSTTYSMRVCPSLGAHSTCAMQSAQKRIFLSGGTTLGEVQTFPAGIALVIEALDYRAKPRPSWQSDLNWQSVLDKIAALPACNQITVVMNGAWPGKVSLTATTDPKKYSICSTPSGVW